MKFEAEDFNELRDYDAYYGDELTVGEEAAKLANAKLQAWLDEAPQVVKMHSGDWTEWNEPEICKVGTVTAKLIDFDVVKV